MRMRTKIIGGLVLFAAIAACVYLLLSLKEPVESVPKVVRSEAPTAVRFAYIPISVAAPLYVAIEEGMFVAENLKAEIQPIRSGSLIIDTINSGDIDIGFSNTLSLLMARAAGMDLQSIGGVAINDKEHNDGAILVLSDSPIKTITDLRGKTIAINARKNIVHLSILRLLRQNNMKPEQNPVKFVENPFPTMEDVLRSKQVDVIAVAEPFWTYAEERGGVRVIGYYFVDVYNELEIASWVSTEAWLKKNPVTAHKVNKILLAAVNFLNDPRNDSRVRQIISKYTKISIDTAKQMRLPGFKLQLTEAGLQKLLDDMIAENILGDKVPLHHVIADFK